MAYYIDSRLSLSKNWNPWLNTSNNSGRARALALLSQSIGIGRSPRTRRKTGGSAEKLPQRPSKLINTPGILLKAIRQGSLYVQAADLIKVELEANRFKMSFKSFRELV